MITFKCKRSGNTVSFDLEDDIAQMRKHEEYDEVKDESKTKEITPKNADENADEKGQVLIKKRGRPAKR